MHDYDRSNRLLGTANSRLNGAVAAEELTAKVIYHKLLLDTLLLRTHSCSQQQI